MSDMKKCFTQCSERRFGSHTWIRIQIQSFWKLGFLPKCTGPPTTHNSLVNRIRSTPIITSHRCRPARHRNGPEFFSNSQWELANYIDRCGILHWVSSNVRYRNDFCYKSFHQDNPHLFHKLWTWSTTLSTMWLPFIAASSSSGSWWCPLHQRGWRQATALLHKPRYAQEHYGKRAF